MLTRCYFSCVLLFLSICQQARVIQYVYEMSFCLLAMFRFDTWFFCGSMLVRASFVLNISFSLPAYASVLVMVGLGCEQDQKKKEEDEEKLMMGQLLKTCSRNEDLWICKLSVFYVIFSFFLFESGIIMKLSHNHSIIELLSGRERVRALVIFVSILMSCARYQGKEALHFSLSICVCVLCDMTNDDQWSRTTKYCNK